MFNKHAVRIQWDVIINTIFYLTTNYSRVSNALRNIQIYSIYIV